MSANTTLLLHGAAAGLSIAVPIGPMGMLCMQRSLHGGFLSGFGTGLGGVTVNVAYASILLLGLEGVMPAAYGGSHVLGALGGLFLLWSAVRVFTSAPVRVAGGRSASRTGHVAGYLSAVGLNAANPLSLILMIAALSPTLRTGLPDAAGTTLLLAGLALAASTWWALLSLAVSLLRSRLSPRMVQGANRLAGTALGVYAVVALARAYGL